MDKSPTLSEAGTAFVEYLGELLAEVAGGAAATDAGDRADFIARTWADNFKGEPPAPKPRVIGLWTRGESLLPEGRFERLTAALAPHVSAPRLRELGKRYAAVRARRRLQPVAAGTVQTAAAAFDVPNDAIIWHVERRQHETLERHRIWFPRLIPIRATKQTGQKLDVVHAADGVAHLVELVRRHRAGRLHCYIEGPTGLGKKQLVLEFHDRLLEQFLPVDGGDLASPLPFPLLVPADRLQQEWEFLPADADDEAYARKLFGASGAAFAYSVSAAAAHTLLQSPHMLVILEGWQVFHTRPLTPRGMKYLRRVRGLVACRTLDALAGPLAAAEPEADDRLTAYTVCPRPLDTAAVASELALRVMAAEPSTTAAALAGSLSSFATPVAPALSSAAAAGRAEAAIQSNDLFAEALTSDTLLFANLYLAELRAQAGLSPLAWYPYPGVKPSGEEPTLVGCVAQLDPRDRDALNREIEKDKLRGRRLDRGSTLVGPTGEWTFPEMTGASKYLAVLLRRGFQEEDVRSNRTDPPLLPQFFDGLTVQDTIDPISVRALPPDVDGSQFVVDRADLLPRWAAALLGDAGQPRRWEQLEPFWISYMAMLPYQPRTPHQAWADLALFRNLYSSEHNAPGQENAIALRYNGTLAAAQVLTSVSELDDAIGKWASNPTAEAFEIVFYSELASNLASQRPDLVKVSAYHDIATPLRAAYDSIRQRGNADEWRHARYHVVEALVRVVRPSDGRALDYWTGDTIAETQDFTTWARANPVEAATVLGLLYDRGDVRLPSGQNLPQLAWALACGALDELTNPRRWGPSFQAPTGLSTAVRAHLFLVFRRLCRFLPRFRRQELIDNGPDREYLRADDVVGPNTGDTGYILWMLHYLADEVRHGVLPRNRVVVHRLTELDRMLERRFKSGGRTGPDYRNYLTLQWLITVILRLQTGEAVP